MSNDKIKLIKEQKEREIKELQKKLNDVVKRLSAEKEQTNELKQKMAHERDLFSIKLRTMNTSIEHSSADISGTQSSKSKSKNMKYLAAVQ